MTGTVGRRKLCLVCSSSEDLVGGGPHGSLLSRNPLFSQFCEELEESCGDKNEQLFSAVEFLKLVEKGAQFLFVCGGCLALITDADGTRRKVEEAEVEVLKLQVELLEKMRALRECTRVYVEGMGRIYGKVKGADLTPFEEAGEEDEGNGDFNGQSAVMTFREKIMDVAGYLGVFQERLDDKLNINSKALTGPLSSPASLHENVDPLEDLPAELDDPDFQLDSPTPSTTDAGENILIKSEAPRTRTRRRVAANKKKIITEHLGIEADISDDDYVPPKKKKKKSKPKQKAPPQPKKPPPASNPIEPSQNPKLLQIDFSSMSPYKAQFIRHVLTHLDPAHRSHKFHKNEPSSSSGYQDPTKIYLWDYDPPSDTMTLAGHPILFEETGSLLVLICSLCEFRLTMDFSPQNELRPRNPAALLQARMFDHVVGLFHLDAYKCPQCSKQHRTLSFFKIHMKTHDPDFQDRIKFFCDKCPYRADARYKLKGHMITHMEEGEAKNEAIRKRDGPQRRNHGGTITCKTCGKSGFCSKSSLKTHQETHLDIDKRPTVICPQCGVRMLKMTFHSHIQDKRCPKMEVEKIPCEHCGKTFKQEDLKRHLVLRHSELSVERPWQCQDCRKGFAVQTQLKSHRRDVHHVADASTHPCKKGCGRRFATVINLTKHEMKCEGGTGAELQTYL